METSIKSIDNLPLKHKNKIAFISDERSNGDGFWIYLTTEYAGLSFDPGWNCRTIHEETIGACIERLKKSQLVTSSNSNE